MGNEKIIRIGKLVYCYLTDKVDELQDKDGIWILNKIFWRFYWLSK